MMYMRDLMSAMATIAPLQFAEPWDNVGLLVGDETHPVAGVLLTIDYTREVAAEAVDLRCDAIIAYHPPMFSAVKRITAGGPSDLIHDAIRRGISIYSPHTAWDAAIGGTNDVLADVLGLNDRAPTGVGQGRIGNLAIKSNLKDLANRLKTELGLAAILVAGNEDRMIGRIAICAGSGGDLLDAAIAEKAELFVTGELRHHDALKAAHAGLTVICTLHSNSERVSLTRLKARLEELIPPAHRPPILLSRVDRDPFVVR